MSNTSIMKSLRNLMITAVVSTPIVTLNAQNAVADQQDFRLYNRTAFIIEQLYVSPSGNPTWEEDVLGRDVLPSGQSTMINFYGDSNVCLFDIKVVFTDGSSLQNRQLNLCRLSEVNVR